MTDYAVFFIASRRTRRVQVSGRLCDEFFARLKNVEILIYTVARAAIIFFSGAESEVVEMQSEFGYALFVLLFVLYGGVGVWLGRRFVSMPMAFVLIGLVIGNYGLDLLSIHPRNELVRQVTEMTLAMLLFADASSLNLKRIEQDIVMPGRLLSIGFLLTLLFGAVVAYVLFPSDGWGIALLIAAILAPSDAALGLAVYTDALVPIRIRRALNVESGLNDGLATPFVTLFLALAVAEEGVSQQGWLTSALMQIVIAVLVGVAAGFIGGRFLLMAKQRGWTRDAPLQFAVLALAFVAYIWSSALGGNGFIAAFVGGLVFGAATRGQLEQAAEYTEATGTLLSVLVWTIFGALLVGPALESIGDWRVMLYAVLSLTVIRMLPVAIAMTGMRLRMDTRLVMGWFGPRGLASVVFVLMAVDTLAEGNTDSKLLSAVVTWTILLSVLAHGLSAHPLVNWYARRLKRAPRDAAEFETVPELRVRNNVMFGHSDKVQPANVSQE